MPDCKDTHDEVYEINLRLDVEPASVQSSKNRRAAFAEVVREAVAKHDFLIVGDVRLVIEWMLHEQSKYESDRAADIDNILKPLIDSLTGPDGLLVDDTMIQSVNCAWIDHTAINDVVNVRIDSVSSESISEIAMSRKSLVFVEVDTHLYFPVDETLPGVVRRIILESVKGRIPIRDQIRNLTGSYYAGQYIMPIQRLFHKSRVVRFRLYPFDEYLATLPPIPIIHPTDKDSVRG